jgi:hypothetical protein
MTLRELPTASHSGLVTNAILVLNSLACDSFEMGQIAQVSGLRKEGRSPFFSWEVPKPFSSTSFPLLTWYKIDTPQTWIENSFSHVVLCLPQEMLAPDTRDQLHSVKHRLEGK